MAGPRFSIGSASPAFTFVLLIGLFYAGYGGGWLLGSIATGLLYEQSRTGLIVFAVAAQLASLPLFLIARRWEPSANHESRKDLRHEQQ
jgi:hypothetical protein